MEELEALRVRIMVLVCVTTLVESLLSARFAHYLRISTLESVTQH